MSEILQRDSQDVEDIAAGLGLVAFMPQPDELFIDIDNPYTYQDSDVSRALLNNEVRILSSVTTTSNNGNQHKYIKLNTLIGQVERISLQACFGSDRVKEALSLLRCLMGNKESAVALFETAVEAKKVQKWRKLHARS